MTLKWQMSTDFCERMDGRRMDGWMDDLRVKWMGGWVEGWMDERMDGWKDKLKGGWMEGYGVGLGWDA